jgi:uncharacterized protein (TIGR04168 family)
MGLRDGACLIKAMLIAVIGDVHDLWEPTDALALEHLGVDLALFVGDFGNESIEIVTTIAQLPLPIAVALGNHDAWYSATPWGRQQCPYNRLKIDLVQAQLDVLGVAHVGYGCRELPDLGLAVVGGRPFSWGGPDWKYADFYQSRFGVSDLTDSTTKITAAGLASSAETLLVLSHNGPFGLGENPDSPCGRDWQPLGGDFGDPDLAAAIQKWQAAGKQIPLVAFGHMHHQLRHTRQVQRQMIHVQDHEGSQTAKTKTIYLNAAAVPRIKSTPQGRVRNFTLVSLDAGQVTDVNLTWLGEDLQIISQEILYQN